MTNMIKIEVAYALPDKQRIEVVSVPEGCSAIEAVKQSGIENHFDDLVITDDIKLGVFGKAVPGKQALKDGDRIEIYRPLIADPKEARKARAAKAKAAKEEAE